MALPRIWTPDELREIRRLYPKMSDFDLSIHFRTTTNEVHAIATRLALRKSKIVFKGRPMPRWDADEIERLVDLYPSHSNQEIARILGRSADSVARKGARLGLKKSELRRAIAGADNVRLRRKNPPRSDVS